MIRKIQIRWPHVIYLCVSLVLVCLLVACDRVTVGNKNDIVEENPNDVFYTTKEALSINPTSLQGLESAKQISISQAPQHGEARFTDNGLVYYRFTGISTVNKDNLILKGISQSGVAVNKEIVFNIVASSEELPCFAGAIGEKLSIEMSTATTIDVTKNDKTCASISSIAIEVQPRHGTAIVQNQKVVYSPEKDFLGEDIFFYRIGIPNTKNPVAPVELTIVEPNACVQGIKDDVLSLTNYTLNSPVAIDILQNDVICSLYQQARLKIVAQPQWGTISIDEKNFDRPIILYQVNKAYTGVDSFTYGLYRDSTHFVEAKVTVTINP